MKTAKILLALSSVAALSACVSDPRIDNVAGQPSVYQDVSSSSKLQGVGIESQDVVAMTDKMMRSMMSNPMITGRSTPPRVLICLL